MLQAPKSHPLASSSWLPPRGFPFRWGRGRSAWAYGAQKSAVRPVGAPVRLRRATLVLQSARMLQTPSSPLSPLLRRGVGLSGPWSAFSAPPKRGGSVGPGMPPLRPSEEGWVGAGTSAAGDALPPKRAGGAGAQRGSRSPEGACGSRSAPDGLAGCEGQAPRCPLFRRASPFRRWVSALHRGDSSRWRTLAAPPKRRCQVCFRSQTPKRWGVSTGALR